ncbi:MAG: hypothetical protein AAF610_02605 [Pseudomonadota bacterium]
MHIPPMPESVTVTRQHSEQLKRRTIDSDEAAHAEIKNWLENNQSGWQRYRITQPVGRYIVDGAGLQLNVSDAWVILTQMDRNTGSFGRQWVRDDPNGSLAMSLDRLFAPGSGED